jgi:clan AA aspartic protease
MIFGHVRDYSPRLTLTLDSEDGIIDIEFVVDTGFEGELALPPSLASKVALQNLKKRLVLMADGTERLCLVGRLLLEWNEETRPTEVLVLDGNPLLGMMLMENSRVCLEVTDGGEVVIEAL